MHVMLPDPQSPSEWREAVTLAEVLLDVDAARMYGLIRGGPPIDANRCLELLAGGRARGILPRSADVNAMTQALVRGLCERV
jgi:hypothetical protein